MQPQHEPTPEKKQLMREQKEGLTIPAELLSIIITTSPVKSNPCTQLIDSSIESIREQTALRDIHIYIVCDGVKIYHENKYKSGAITEEFLQKYREYKEQVKEKYGRETQKFTIIEREEHNGFAENIKYVMQNYAFTDHVLIYQHDHIIDGYIDFYSTLQSMRKFPQINYVTFMNKTYTTIVARMCGHVPLRDYLLSLIKETKQTFNVIKDIEGFTQRLISEFANRFDGLKVIPINFWYDKVHMARRSYYLEVIFRKYGNYDPHVSKHMKTVSFVEDTFGQCMKWTIQEHPQKILDFGAYLVWEKESVFYHNSGRAFITSLEKQEIEKERVQINKIRMENASSSGSDGEGEDGYHLEKLEDHEQHSM